MSTTAGRWTSSLIAKETVPFRCSLIQEVAHETQYNFYKRSGKIYYPEDSNAFAGKIGLNLWLCGVYQPKGTWQPLAKNRKQAGRKGIQKSVGQYRARSLWPIIISATSSWYPSIHRSVIPWNAVNALPPRIVFRLTTQNFKSWACPLGSVSWRNMH